MEAEILYSYTEGPIIAAKLRQILGDENYIRMGISFPLSDEYRKTAFKPENNYCNISVLEYLLDVERLINDSINEENKNYNRRLLVTKTDLCYGGTIEAINTETRKGIGWVNMTREPIKEKDEIHLNELKKISDTLKDVHSGVALYKESDSYLSATTTYSPLTEIFGMNMDILDIKIPKESLGLRIEFYLPERFYSHKKIEDPFDAVACHLGFNKMIASLEEAHNQFLDLKEKSIERKGLKVVKKVEV